MRINLWYDYIISNQFINNFTPYETVKQFVNSNDRDSFQNMDCGRINSILPDYLKSLKSSKINYQCSASIPYKLKQFRESINFVPFEPWFFNNSLADKISFDNSFITNWIDQHHNNTEILVWYPDEGFGVFNRPKFFDKFHEQFPRNKIRFVFGSLKTPQWTNDVDWLIYKPFDSWWYRTQQIDQIPSLNINKVSTKSFSFYNRRFRMHRAVMFKELLDSNMLEHADYTYHACTFGDLERNPNYLNDYAAQHIEEIKLSPKNNEYESLINSRKFLDFSSKQLSQETVESVNSPLYEKDFFYNDSYLDLITETLINDNEDNLFITEKTYRSIASGNIFLIVGQPGVLKYLKSHGIQTFDDLFDESYDSKLHWYERWKIIKNNLILWINLGPKKQEQYYKDNFSKIQHNRYIIFNRNFNNEILDLFDEDTGFF